MPIFGDGRVNSMPGGGTLKVRCAPSSIRGQTWCRSFQSTWNLIQHRASLITNVQSNVIPSHFFIKGKRTD
jgi:hypothetical protein